MFMRAASLAVDFAVNESPNVRVAEEQAAALKGVVVLICMSGPRPES
jgi:hypothetical protein